VPQKWYFAIQCIFALTDEPLRQILEILAERLFDDSTLLDKHKKYLDQLIFDRSLNSKKSGKRTHTFTEAAPNALNQGVIDTNGEQAPTPHHYYVDDGVYAEIFDTLRIKRAVAASIEAIFILLGDSHLQHRQDPVSFDKVIEMVISWTNRVLGHMIDTNKLTVGVPRDFLNTVVSSLRSSWGDHRKCFTVPQAAELTGQLNHIAITAPWLKFLMTQVYASMATALKLNESELVRTSKSFRIALGKARHSPLESSPTLEQTFYQGETARKIHKSQKTHFINSTLRAELNLIRATLSDPTISTTSPIAHLIDRVAMAWAFCDSSLRAAEGYCTTLKFWWYIQWPDHVQQRTLRFIKNNKDGKLIDINVLEYASILITYLISCNIITTTGLLETDPHPTLRVSGDNSSLMLNNPVRLLVDHISTVANVVADKISRIELEEQLTHQIPTIMKEHPELAGCQCFHLSSSLVSTIMEMLLRGECTSPLELSKQLHSDPGKITS
jgi:hypothetical protein